MNEKLCDSTNEVLPLADDLRKLIFNLKKPLVIKNSIEDWQISKWTLQDWNSALGSVKLPFRVGTRNCTKTPQWEGSCTIKKCSLEEFLEATEKNEVDEWMYFDYKYMIEWFKNHPIILESISWASLGFPEVQGEDSTIWFGNKGAHTPCHFDSYSLNLVAQLYGKKAWLLFPPDDVDLLQPTRIPYEESSIFSKINFFCRKSLKGLKEAYFVILNPGDVLVVPNGWWHYVENIETSISVNTWIPLDIDDEKRLEECLVRTFIGSMVENLDETEKQLFLNPNEVLQMKNFDPSSTEMLNLCVQIVKRKRREGKLKRSDDATSTLQNQQIIKSSCMKFVEKFVMDDIIKILPCSCSNSGNSADPYSEKQSEVIKLHDIINAFCHPDIVSKVKEKFLVNF